MDQAASSRTTSSTVLQEIPAYGLSEVARGGENPDFDIVFIHGLEGHPEKTWTYGSKPNSSLKPDTSSSEHEKQWYKKIFSKKPKSTDARRSSNAVDAQDQEADDGHIRPDEHNGTHGSGNLGEHGEPNDDKLLDGAACFWPREFLSVDFPHARVFTYGYDASISHFFTGPANQDNILDRGRDLLQRIEVKRKYCRDRRLIFIVHSLGGIVIKSALRIAADATGEEEDFKHIFQSTVAVLFFGTPHRGSRWVNSGQILRSFASAFGFSTSRINLDLLAPNDAMLQLLRDDFRRRLDDGAFNITSYQESLGYKGVRGFQDKIVDPDSSAMEHRQERKQPINANHVNMCRFNRRGQSWVEYQEKVKPEIERHMSRFSRVLYERTLDSLQGFANALMIRLNQIEGAHHRTLSWIIREDQRGPGLMPWLKVRDGLFWIQGLPGSGKSTAMKFVVQSQEVAKKLGSEGYLYAAMFLTDRIAQENRSWTGVLGAMLYCLLDAYPQLFSSVVSTIMPPGIKETYQSLVWSVDTLEKALMSCKSQRSVRFSFCFFVDALDESDSDEVRISRIVHFMKQLALSDGKGFGSIKICAASRPENDISLGLQDTTGFRIQDWTYDDIRQYIHERLETHPVVIQETAKVPEYLNHLRDICKIVVKRAEGVFLWVRLVVDNVYASLSRGEFLTSIQKKLLKLPNKEMPDFFLALLDNTPLETRRDAYVILETVVQAKEPVTVLHIGILLLLMERGIANYDEYIIDEDVFHTLCSSGPALERRIRDATGGLLQLEGPEAWPAYEARLAQLGVKVNDIESAKSFFDVWDSLNRNDQEMENLENHLLDLARAPKQEVQPAVWKVQFLHQTVKEFLLTADLDTRSRIDSTLLVRPGAIEEDVGDGYSLLLQVGLAYMYLSDTERRHHDWTLDGKEMTLKFAPMLDRTRGESSFGLLSRLDRRLTEISPEAEYWPENVRPGLFDKAWGTTFLAFAIGNNMQHYVKESLRTQPGLIEKPKRPLLHYAAFYPGMMPNARMAEILLHADADPNWVFDESPQWSKNSIESMLFSDTSDNGQAYVGFIKVLVEHGASATTKIPSATSFRPGVQKYDEDSWTTLLHWFASTSIPWMMRLDLFEFITSRSFGNLNSCDSFGFTAFEALIMNSMSQDITSSHLRRLLALGAKITVRMVHKICTPPKARVWNYLIANGFSTGFDRICAMLLNEEFRHEKFYDCDAKRLLAGFEAPRLSILPRHRLQEEWLAELDARLGEHINSSIDTTSL